MKLKETKKSSECQFAKCDHCDFQADSMQAYWSVQKSIGLHRRGCPDHKVRMYKLVEQVSA